ncbi:type VI secretion system protein ImpM [Duganella sp. CF458]|uniref:type VI secretion system-associated protein TagF n=1 Tax=Duganella sp. CF458 TaxID=1884368 RepID=UPI0008F15304|nr:type VI secretion system-associated protein TagF [Duganella sp. CF458]SFG93099.1 type VI secretion system protein ImpM [Duganella sp. CF458]
MNVRMQRIAYFGKLPGCGDFVRSPGDQILVELMDQWLAAVMQRLAANPRWRQHYDACPPLDFAFIGTRSRQVVCGHLLASRDQSARRFPFTCMAVHHIVKPRDFLPCSPLALAPAWEGLAIAAGAATGAAVRPVDGISPVPLTESSLAEAALQDYMAGACLASLEDSLAGPSGGVPARNLLLALGLLLSPLREGAPVTSRCLALPLPRQAVLRAPVAAFWMSLAAPLLARQDLEIAMFLGPVAGQPSLVLGLDGANPASLFSVIDPESVQENMVVLGDCAWAEGAVHGEAPLQRLSACLEQGQLGLPVAIQLFHETFC